MKKYSMRGSYSLVYNKKDSWCYRPTFLIKGVVRFKKLNH